MTIHDITDGKKTETRMQHFACILEFSEDAIISESPDGNITSWSTGAERMFGYTALEITGRSMSVLCPDDKREEGKELLEKTTGGESVLRYQSRRIRKNRQVIDVIITMAPVRDSMGHVISVTTIMRDVTSQRQVEDDLRESRKAAQLASRAKNEFLANMSHEIRTPLNGIIGLAHLMMNTDLTPMQDDYMKKIQLSSQALLGVLTDILDYSKIEAGHMQLEEMEFNLDDLLAMVTDLFSLKAEEKGLGLYFDISSDVPERFIGDQHRLGQILCNLVGNAVKFTPEGDVHLTIGITEKSEHHVSLSVSVTDTGIGISEESCRKLFSPFSQADGSASREYGGTGLGLAISKNIIEMMNGTIQVESTRGDGSTFQFSVRLKTVNDRPPIRDPRHLKEMRVLVADDTAVSRNILSRMLESWKFTVVTAESGQDALLKIEQSVTCDEPFDLYFLDWKMSGCGGPDITKYIYSHAANRDSTHSPIVIMAGQFGRKYILTQSDRIQVDSVLDKPVTPSRLFDVLIGIQSAKKTTDTFEKPGSVLNNTTESKANGIQIGETDMDRLTDILQALMLTLSQYRIVTKTDLAGLKAVLTGTNMAHQMIKLERQIENYDYSSGMATLTEIAAACSISL